MAPLEKACIEIKGNGIHKIDTVKGNLVTLIFGAYHLPKNDNPKMKALIM
jgi:hypothetical protein